MKVGDHDLHFGQGANVSKCKGNAKELCYIAIIAHIAAWLKCANFHWTVLEAYWEFGAGIGTKMFALNSTFSSFVSF